MRIHLAPLLTLTTAGLPRAASPPHYIFSFGDSYTDTSFRPAGTPPAPDCPLGNPNCFVGGSYTGGHNWLSAATTLANRSVAVTWNFAHSGDVLDSAQEGLGGRQGVRGAQWPVAREVLAGVAPGEAALWSVWIGVNDVDIAFRTAGDSWWRGEMASYRWLLEEMRTVGARWFLLQAVPALERTPRYVTADEDTRRKLAGAVRRWNDELAGVVAQFVEAYPETHVLLFDSYAAYNRVLDAPGTYGFKDATSVCRTGECVWNDGFHPSEAAQVLVGGWVAEELEQVGFWGERRALPAEDVTSGDSGRRVVRALAVVRDWVAARWAR